MNESHRSKYLIEYLELTWEQNTEAGTRTWILSFQDALDTWQHEQCEQLLREIKQRQPTAQIEALIRYAEGVLSEQKGELERAIHFYGEVLRLNLQLKDRYRVASTYESLGLVNRKNGELQFAARHLKAALDEYEAISADKKDIVDVLCELALLHLHQGDHQQANDYLTAAQQLAESDESSTRLNVTSGEFYQVQGDLELAERAYTDASCYFRQTQDDENLANVLNNLGVLAIERLQLDEARTYLMEAITVHQAHNDWTGVAHSLGNLALAEQSHHNYEQASHHYANAISLVTEIGDKRAQAIYLNLLGTVHLEQGKWDIASDYLQQSLTQLANVGDQLAQIDVLNNLGNAHRHQSQLQHAENYYQEALFLAESADDSQRKGQILANWGHLYDLRNETEQAWHCYEQAKRIAEQFDDLESISVAMLGLCAILFERAEFERLTSELLELWSIAERSNQYDVLIRASWIRGDVLILLGELNDGFSLYAGAVVMAVEHVENLLEATLERIDMHFDFLRVEECKEMISIVCTILQEIWKEAGLFITKPELDAWLKHQSQLISA